MQYNPPPWLRIIFKVKKLVERDWGTHKFLNHWLSKHGNWLIDSIFVTFGNRVAPSVKTIIHPIISE
jgi:hypothetical protein